MSKTGIIKIESLSTIIDEKTFEKILTALMNSAWDIQYEGTVLFMLNGTYDFEESSEIDQSLKRIYKSISEQQITELTLYFKEEIYKIGISYLNSKEISFNITEDIKYMESFTIIDFSWYLKQVATAFVFLDSIRIICIYD